MQKVFYKYAMMSYSKCSKLQICHDADSMARAVLAPPSAAPPIVQASLHSLLPLIEWEGRTGFYAKVPSQLRSGQCSFIRGESLSVVHHC